MPETIVDIEREGQHWGIHADSHLVACILTHAQTKERNKFGLVGEGIKSA